VGGRAGVDAGGGRADEPEAVKATEKLGGKVGRDGKAPGRPVTVVDLNGRPATWATMTRRSGIPRTPGSASLPVPTATASS
jgi:hypothetical protein